MSSGFTKGMEEMILNVTGMSVGEIRLADHETVRLSIEKKIGHKLRFGYEPGLVPRNVLLAEGRIIWPEELESPGVFVTAARLAWLYAKSPFKRVFWVVSRTFFKAC